MSATNHSRIPSVDILRGIVMIIMALDHSRDYFSDFKFDPTDLHHAGPGMFFTRWITHFCAPVFFFLSGTSSFLSAGAGKSKGQLSRLLLSRGIWLIVLELTIIRFGWTFNLDYSEVWLQVIWAFGWCMMLLALLVHLPAWAILAISLAIITGHNLLDNVPSNMQNEPWWKLVHQEGGFSIPGGIELYVLYPVVPWIGVMGAGYCFGHWIKGGVSRIERKLFATGAVCIICFVLLRLFNVYGDPAKWQVYPLWWQTALSFIDCTKYPASLLFLLMTLGPAILVLPLLDKLTSGIKNVLSVYGRTALFFYIVHIYLIHALALVVATFLGYPLSLFTVNDFLYNITGWGFGLGVVYSVWTLVVALLYLPCKWFMEIKTKHRKWWLSYL